MSPRDASAKTTRNPGSSPHSCACHIGGEEVLQTQQYPVRLRDHVSGSKDEQATLQACSGTTNYFMQRSYSNSRTLFGKAFENWYAEDFAPLYTICTCRTMNKCCLNFQGGQAPAPGRRCLSLLNVVISNIVDEQILATISIALQGT